jgi:hypothetical protein
MRSRWLASTRWCASKPGIPVPVLLGRLRRACPRSTGTSAALPEERDNACRLRPTVTAIHSAVIQPTAPDSRRDTSSATRPCLEPSLPQPLAGPYRSRDGQRHDCRPCGHPCANAASQRSPRREILPPDLPIECRRRNIRVCCLPIRVASGEDQPFGCAVDDCPNFRYPAFTSTARELDNCQPDHAPKARS